MYEAELENVYKRIEDLCNIKYFDGKDIYLFGVSDNTRQIIQILRLKGFSPLNVIDNDRNKINSFCAGVKVIGVEGLSYSSNATWVIYSSYWREMKRQLLDKGISEKQIIVLFEKEKSVFIRLSEALKGKRIYKNLKKKYGDVPMFLCPYTGTGDIYLIGSFWDEYTKKNNISEYVFLVISGACKKVALLFDIKNVELLKSQKDSEYLIRYYSLCPNDINLKLLNDAWAQINDNNSEWFRGYKGMYFTELFRKFVFDLPDNSKPKHPHLKDATKEIDKYFKEYNLQINKTVILSPYSNTLADLPLSFWEKICKGLIDKGYSVCTNSSGPNELAIKGSNAIFFPLNVAPQFLSRAGGFIGVRSGFCDVISGSIAKKVILYDSGNRFYNCSAFEYFSLSRMGLCDDAIEIEYVNTELEKTANLIVKYF